jgi:hypothetical protein
MHPAWFFIGKHNWWLIDTIRRAKSSAIIYSITKTAKANGLKVYDYAEHLLTEMPKHEDDTTQTVHSWMTCSHGPRTCQNAVGKPMNMKGNKDWSKSVTIIQVCSYFV